MPSRAAGRRTPRTVRDEPGQRRDRSWSYGAPTSRPDANGLANLVQRRHQEGAHLGGALAQDVLDHGRIGGQLATLLAHRPEELDDALGKQLLGVHAPRARGALAVLDLQVVATEEAVQLADVADLGTPGVGPLDAQRVRHHAHDDAADRVRLGASRGGVVGALCSLSVAYLDLT